MITDTKYIINERNIVELAMNVYSLFECRKNIVCSNEDVKHQNFTIKLYTNVMSENLLDLAIRIRILLYQGYKFDPDNVDMLIANYEKNENQNNWINSSPISIKDICDKIIHAKDILIISGLDNQRIVFRDDIQLIGNQKVKGKSVQWLMCLKPNNLYEYLLSNLFLRNLKPSSTKTYAKKQQHCQKDGKTAK